jgi:hypothetical protein
MEGGSTMRNRNAVLMVLCAVASCLAVSAARADAGRVGSPTAQPSSQAAISQGPASSRAWNAAESSVSDLPAASAHQQQSHSCR